MGYEDRPEQPQIHQFGGLNVRDTELALPGDDSPYMINVDLHPEGSIKKRMGMSALTAPSGVTKVEAVMGLVQPEQSRGWVYIIAHGKVYRTADPGTWSWSECTSTPAYTLPDVDVWGRENSRYLDGTTEHASVLYLPRSNGAPLIALGSNSATNDIKALPQAAWGTGATGTGTSGYPINEGDEFKAWGTNHWPKFMRLIGIGKGARMHAWGFADEPNRVDFSELDVPFNFMRSNMDDVTALAQPLIDGGWYIARPGDQDAVVSVVDMFSYTVVFKKNRTLIYSGDPGSPDWTVAADFPVGCVSDRAWRKVGNDLLFWSADGIRALSAVQEYGDLAQGDLSWKIQPLTRAIAPGQHDLIFCYHDITNARVVWFAPMGGTAYNDTAFVYYYNTKKWTQFTGDYCNVMDVALLRGGSVANERLVGGSYASGIVLMQSGFADLTEDVEATYYTNWLNFGSISDSERALWLDMFFGSGGTDVNIYCQLNLNEEWIPITRVVSGMGGSGSVWGTFKWGEKLWGVPGRAHRRFEMNGLFGLVRFKFTATGQSAFEIMGYKPEIRMKGPRA